MGKIFLNSRQYAGGGDYHEYSTAEHIVGTWVDGSPIYEKTIYYAGGQSGAIEFPHGISDLGLVISYEGFCQDDPEAQYTSNGFFPFPRIATDGNQIGVGGVDATNVIVSVPTAFNQRIINIYVTLRYTKSA